MNVKGGVRKVKDCLLTDSIDNTAPLDMTLHEYIKSSTLSQLVSGTCTFAAMRRDIFRVIRTSLEPRMRIVGVKDLASSSLTVIEEELDRPKKLTSRNANTKLLGRSSARGILIGLVTELLFRNAWMWTVDMVDWRLSSTTDHSTTLHGLPPCPREEEASKMNSLHRDRAEGASRTTSGAIALLGGLTRTTFWVDVGNRLQLIKEVGHLARTLPGRRVIVELRSTREEELIEMDETVARTTKESTQTHRLFADPWNTNNALQLHEDSNKRPRSVEESKVMDKYEPSGENSAETSTGDGTMTSDVTTGNCR